jgi:CubicO group peptidase (beta-lactamase class C family)
MKKGTLAFAARIETRLAAAGLLAALLAAGCAGERAPASVETADRAPLAQAIDAHLSERRPSGAFLFAVDGRVVFAKGYGVLREGGPPLTADAVFPVGSLTKQFTAAAVLRLAERRKLRLEDRLGRFFPDAPADKMTITVQQLLAHNSGLARNAGDVYDRVAPQEARRRIFAQPLASAPGAQHAYSNSGYILLGQIVERVSGRSLGDFFEQQLFRPAGMARTGYPSARFAGAPIPRGYDRPKFGEIYSATPMSESGGQDPRFRFGNGGVLSTVGDLYLWVRALSGGRIVSRRWIAEMQAPHALITPDGKYRYGYAWVVEDSRSGRMLWHNGVWYSYYSEIRYFPDAGVIGIGFTNRQQDEIFDQSFAGALKLVLKAAAGPRPPGGPSAP